MKTRLSITARTAAAVAIGGIVLAGCGGDDTEDNANAGQPAAENPPADEPETAEEPETEEPPADTTESAEEPSDAPDVEPVTGEEPPEDEGEEPTAAPEDGSADPAGGEDLTEAVQAEATTYTDALVSEDWETAYGMLSDASIAELGLTGPEDLANEPWVPALLENLADTPFDIAVYPTSDQLENAFAVTAATENYAHAVGVRQIGDEIVIDQSRTDTATGGPWVEFVNPDWEGNGDAVAPISFVVDALSDNAPSSIVLQSDTSDGPIPTESTPGDAGFTYTAESAPDGTGVLVVSGQLADDTMIRVHAIAYQAAEDV